VQYWKIAGIFSFLYNLEKTRNRATISEDTYMVFRYGRSVKKRRKKGRDALKDWFERLKRWILADEEATGKENEIHEEAGFAPFPIVNKNLRIRTASIYPKRNMTLGEREEEGSVPRVPQRAREREGVNRPRRRERERFPFPLIPDEPKGAADARYFEPEVSSRSSLRSSSDNVPASSIKQEPVERTRTGVVGRRDGKRPFRPTEVISPVYGRKRPEQYETEKRKEVKEPLSYPLNTLVHPMNLKKVEEGREKEKAPVTSVVTDMQEETVAAIKEVATHEVHRQGHIEEKLVEERFESAELPSFVFLPNAREKEEVYPPIQEERMPQAPVQEKEEEPKETVRPVYPIDQSSELSKKENMSMSPSYVEVRSETTIVGKEKMIEKVVEPVESFYPSAAAKEATYSKPPLSLLNPPPPLQVENTEYIERQQEVLATTLHNFNVNAEVIGAVQGPTVTRYEIQPAPGVKVNKITNLIDDIKLSLAARDIRIEAPIPGRSAVGIEVPNDKSMPVFLRSILESPTFQAAASPLTVALGIDIGGEPIVTDLAKMPHGLIAGATGSGKSVCINSIILSLLYKATPEEVRLLLIDPKMVELAPYNRMPHLVTPVVTDPKQATVALKWAVQEMESRYEKFAEAGARDISRYNELMRRAYPGEKEHVMPSIVIIIDELADLMMVAPHDVEEAICRIAQKARACGIHLLVATQRPSVDVITGLIKANIPTRVAFSVSSQTDSRTILDMSGAERLLGRGDMLYLSSGSSKPVRLQGPYVSDEEIEAVTEHVRNQAEPNYLFEKEELTQALMNDNTDDLFAEVVLFCVENGQASASLLQRNFQIGYNRAARLIDMMEEKGFISGYTGSSKPRDVFLTRAEYDELFGGEGRL
jgi:S-DNA-T family DNA segregation ATPase FtsK/SpoIIIE